MGYEIDGLLPRRYWSWSWRISLEALNEFFSRKPALRTNKFRIELLNENAERLTGHWMGIWKALNFSQLLVLLSRSIELIRNWMNSDAEFLLFFFFFFFYFFRPQRRRYFNFSLSLRRELHEEILLL